MARYIAKFSKGRGVKFISHLDLMRCIERALRRADIPVSYSKGFNPHTELSFATPLSVGISSQGEYMDFKLDRELATNIIKDAINEALPQEIKIMSVREANDYFPSLMAIVDAASYDITLVHGDVKKLTQEALNQFLNRPSIEVEKHGKNGTKIVDIKPLIYSIKLNNGDSNTVTLSTVIAAGNKSNLNPELLIGGMKTYISGMDGVQTRDILKGDTYIIKDNKFITPMEADI